MRGLTTVVMLALAMAEAAASPPWADPTAAAADEPAAGPGVTRVDDAVGRLVAADSYADRDAATRRVVTLGEEAVPPLKTLLAATADPEVRQRATFALDRIALYRRIAPTPVTLDLADAPPRAVFDELSRQSGLRFTFHPPGLLGPKTSAPPVTVKAAGAPLWDVVVDVCRRQGAGVRNVYDADALTVVEDAGWDARRGAPMVRGPLLIVPRITRGPAANPQQWRATAVVLVMVDPKVRVVRGSLAVRSARDEGGRSLLAADAATAELRTTYSRHAWHAGIPLAVDAGRVPQGVELVGELRLTFQTRSQTVEIDDVLNARNVTRTAGPFRFTLHDVVPTEAAPAAAARYTLNLSVYRDELPPEDWAWFNFPLKQPQLVDAAGVPLRPRGGGVSGSPDQAVRRPAINFTTDHLVKTVARTGPPKKLIWEFPIEQTDVVVPLKFADLAVPRPVGGDPR